MGAWAESKGVFPVRRAGERGCTGPSCLCLATKPPVTYGRSYVKAAPVPPRGEAESRYESFASTRWSIVIEAGNSGTVSAHAFNALSELCQIYWRPLYSFLRLQGCAADHPR